MKSEPEYSAESIRGSNRGYVAFHARRFAYLIDLLAQLHLDERTRLLDIGRSRLTELIRARFRVQVDSLGFDPEGKTSEGDHYHFDLNDAQSEGTWRRDIPRYDVIVMAEVIEHLYTAPELVLRFLRTLVADNGLVVIQTPNAAALSKRIKLLVGRNPYEMIRVDPTNPGHFREYTSRELTRISAAAGFAVVRKECGWYFDGRFAQHGETPRYQPIVGTVKNLVYPLLPGAWQFGLTFVIKPSKTG
jgi:SAM-dependent methyltransferase